jgi:starvation-inducible DNA-binding protein
LASALTSGPVHNAGSFTFWQFTRPRTGGDSATFFERRLTMKRMSSVKEHDLKQLEQTPLSTPTDLTAEATRDVSGALNALLADVFALYLKTKNFHWHLSGPHFRDYHLMFDEQGDQLFAMTDPIAERVRKIGGSTIKSIGHISRLQRVLDNDADYVEPDDMLAELCEDNKTLAARLREAHNVCEEHRDIATASLIEVWIDETERRTWFLFEASQRQMTAGH